MKSFNLIPACRRLEKQRRSRMRTWIAICVGYVLILVLAWGFCYFTWGGDDRALAKELQKTAAKINSSSAMSRKLMVELSKARATLQASKAIGDQPDWSVLLVLLGKSIDDDLVLSRCELKPVDEGKLSAAGKSSAGSTRRLVPLGNRRYTFRLSGFGRTHTAVLRFVLRLEQVGLFDEVKLIKSDRVPFLGGDAVAFNIECLF